MNDFFFVIKAYFVDLGVAGVDGGGLGEEGILLTDSIY